MTHRMRRMLFASLVIIVSGAVAAAVATTARSETARTGRHHIGVKTVGVLSLCEACEGVHRMTVGMEQATKAIGWKMKLVDGQGAPDKLLAGLQTLVQEKVDAIVIEAVEPALVKQAYKAAVAHHIPIVTEDVGHRSKGALSDISPNERKNTAKLDKVMWKLIGEKPGAKVAAVRYMSLQTTAERFHQLQRDVKKYGLNLVASHDSVAPNFSQDAATFTSTELTANPDLAAVWCASTGDPAAEGAAQAIDRVHGKTIVVGYNGDKAALADIRAGGSFKATIAFPVEEGSWRAVNLLIRHFEGKNVKDREIYLPAAVVTEKNVPKAGAGYFNKWGNYPRRYRRMWKKRYGLK